MRFLNSLYHIESESRTADEAGYTIRLNPDHVIYQAHFPGEPITPGVCILQIGIELLENALGESLEVERVKNVKFLSILRPDDTPVSIRIHRIERNDDRITALADFSLPDTPIAKLSLQCRTTA